ncbi:hypothetical protein DH2020_027035 [Rehmannia glutinosa]|uniref:Uncharacterized protein n=1 Tax=Rehmannia glutinosa TaxID=99300 RepID=A0ABR0VZ35_REHGL
MDSFLEKFFSSIYMKQIEDDSTNMYQPIWQPYTYSVYVILVLGCTFVVACCLDGDQKTEEKFVNVVRGVLFDAGALTNGFARAVWMLIVGRILLGFILGCWEKGYSSSK